MDKTEQRQCLNRLHSIAMTLLDVLDDAKTYQCEIASIDKGFDAIGYYVDLLVSKIRTELSDGDI